MGRWMVEMASALLEVPATRTIVAMVFLRIALVLIAGTLFMLRGMKVETLVLFQISAINPKPALFLIRIRLHFLTPAN
jgi:hypothetical protein